MPDAGIGTLIARRSCGTVYGPEAATFQPAPQSCRKPWFVGQLRRTPETAAALGSPSYKQSPVTEGRLCERVDGILAIVLSALRQSEKLRL
jgi:hypothetical protein